LRTRALAVLALLAASEPGARGAPPTGRVVGKVTLAEANGKAAAATDVIVYVVGFTEPAAGTVTATIHQKERKFVPDLVAVTAGDSVNFPNDDPFLHNVFSQSTARKFDLGSFRKGDAKDKDFKNPGVVDVYCNIHPEMAATILVLPNRRHTRVSADGSFAIDGVPEGKWTVFAYARRAGKPTSASVTVVAGSDASVQLALVRGPEPPHVNKFGEKYKETSGPYK
jgi:plastocyanin